MKPINKYKLKTKNY